MNSKPISPGIWRTYNEDGVWIGAKWRTPSGKEGNIATTGVRFMWISLEPPHYKKLLCECTPEELEEREKDMMGRLYVCSNHS